MQKKKTTMISLISLCSEESLKDIVSITVPREKKKKDLRHSWMFSLDVEL